MALPCNQPRRRSHLRSRLPTPPPTWWSIVREPVRFYGDAASRVRYGTRSRRYYLARINFTLTPLGQIGRGWIIFHSSVDNNNIINDLDGKVTKGTLKFYNQMNDHQVELDQFGQSGKNQWFPLSGLKRYRFFLAKGTDNRLLGESCPLACFSKL